MTLKIVITDCDHDSIVPEKEVAEQYGVDLVLAQATTQDEVIAAAADADGIVVQYARIDAEVLDALPRLKSIGRYGVGVDTIDVDAATARGVAVSNVPDYGTEAVSDHAIGLALAVGRGIVRLDRGLRTGSADFVPIKPLHQVRGRVFGIIGLGLIGTATARKARGMGFEVVAADPRHELGSVVDGVTVVTLEELLVAADVVSMHTPLTPDTHHLLSTEQMAKMKPNAILVNTSRGGVIDTEALVEALGKKRIYGAALDVHETEPIPADHPLTTFDTVVLTPHIAWYTEESYFELKRRTVENVAQLISGERPENILNEEVLKR